MWSSRLKFPTINVTYQEKLVAGLVCVCVYVVCVWVCMLCV